MVQPAVTHHHTQYTQYGISRMVLLVPTFCFCLSAHLRGWLWRGVETRAISCSCILSKEDHNRNGMENQTKCLCFAKRASDYKEENINL